MTFEEVVDQALAMLQRRGRVTYRMLQRHFQLDDAALEDLKQALSLAEEVGMRPLQAHCHRGLGTLFATAGQAEPARAELSTALAMYQAMAMTFWLPQTEAALAQVRG
jgi:tetratricopeptide (TPR) repeat protein